MGFTDTFKNLIYNFWWFCLYFKWEYECAQRKRWTFVFFSKLSSQLFTHTHTHTLTYWLRLPWTAKWEASVSLRTIPQDDSFSFAVLHWFSLPRLPRHWAQICLDSQLLSRSRDLSSDSEMGWSWGSHAVCSAAEIAVLSPIRDQGWEPLFLIFYLVSKRFHVGR